MATASVFLRGRQLVLSLPAPRNTNRALSIFVKKTIGKYCEDLLKQPTIQPLKVRYFHKINSQVQCPDFATLKMAQSQGINAVANLVQNLPGAVQVSVANPVGLKTGLNFAFPTATCLFPIGCMRSLINSRYHISKRDLHKALNHPFYISLKIARERVLSLIQLHPLEQAKLLTRFEVSQHRGMETLLSETELQQAWKTLVPGSFNLAPLKQYDPNDPFKNFQEIFSRRHRPLLRESQISEYSSSDFIRTYTELIWATQKPSLPLAFETIQNHATPIPPQLKNNPLVQYLFNCSQEDAVEAWRLAASLINSQTLVHDYGCWSGGNLLGLLFFGFEQGIHPGACIGTDINVAVLNVAETTSKMLSLDSSLVEFHLSNALYPHAIDLSRFKCEKQIKMALRLLPVLEPSDTLDFLIQAKQSMTADCSLIVSYAIPQGNKYETNKKLASSSQYAVRQDTFEHGVIFRMPFNDPTRLSKLVAFPDRIDQVINCYYTTQGFEKLVHQCGYKILETRTVGEYSDNYRAVAALKVK